MNIKIIVSAKKIIFRILAHVFVRIARISKSSVMFQKLCNEIISVMDIVSTEITNIIATIVTKNCSTKKVRDYYILLLLCKIKRH